MENGRSNGKQNGGFGEQNASCGEHEGKQSGKRKRIDWEAGRVMYARGYSYGEIGEALGTTAKTVKTQARRAGWTDERKKAEELVKEHASASLQEKAKSRAEEWSDAMTESLEKTAHVLREAEPPRTLGELKTFEEVRKLHVETGRKLFGLDEADNKTLVQVNLGNLSAEDAPQGDSSASDDAIEA